MLHYAHLALLQVLAQNSKHLAGIARTEPKRPSVDPRFPQQHDRNSHELARIQEVLQANVSAQKKEDCYATINLGTSVRHRASLVQAHASTQPLGPRSVGRSSAPRTCSRLEMTAPTDTVGEGRDGAP